MNIDKLKKSKVPCTICSKELTKQYMKNHMDKVHIDKDRLKAVSAKKRRTDYDKGPDE